jgi:hypothetical protein
VLTDRKQRGGRSGAVDALLDENEAMREAFDELGVLARPDVEVKSQEGRESVPLPTIRTLREEE